MLVGPDIETNKLTAVVNYMENETELQVHVYSGACKCALVQRAGQEEATPTGWS